MRNILQHVVLVWGGRRVPVTLGTFTVDRILGWDQTNNTM
jgi:hypothetical protein